MPGQEIVLGLRRPLEGNVSLPEASNNWSNPGFVACSKSIMTVARQTLSAQQEIYSLLASQQFDVLRLQTLYSH
jgi:hypothetical protein